MYKKILMVQRTALLALLAILAMGVFIMSDIAHTYHDNVKHQIELGRRIDAHLDRMNRQQYVIMGSTLAIAESLTFSVPQ